METVRISDLALRTRGIGKDYIEPIFSENSFHFEVLFFFLFTFFGANVLNLFYSTGPKPNGVLQLQLQLYQESNFSIYGSYYRLKQALKVILLTPIRKNY